MPGIVWMLLALASAFCMTVAHDQWWRMLWALAFGFFYSGGYAYAKRRGFKLACTRMGRILDIDVPERLKEDEV